MAEADKPMTDLLGLAARADGSLFQVEGPFTRLAVEAAARGWVTIVPVDFRLCATAAGLTELRRRRG